MDNLNKQTSDTVSSLQDTSTQMGKDIETLQKANEDFSKAAFEGINNAQAMGTKAFTETIPQVSSCYHEALTSHRRSLFNGRRAEGASFLLRKLRSMN